MCCRWRRMLFEKLCKAFARFSCVILFSTINLQGPLVLPAQVTYVIRDLRRSRMTYVTCAGKTRGPCKLIVLNRITQENLANALHNFSKSIRLHLQHILNDKLSMKWSAITYSIKIQGSSGIFTQISWQPHYLNFNESPSKYNTSQISFLSKSWYSVKRETSFFMCHVVNY